MPAVTIERRDALARTPAHDVVLACIEAGIDAAHPDRLVADRCSLSGSVLTIDPMDGTPVEYDLDTYDDVILLGGGNAGGTLAAAFENLLGEWLDDGIVVTDDPVPTNRVTVLPGDHPIPSERGVEHTRRVLDRAADANADDLVITAITGGGSALLAAPADSLTLADLRAVTAALLASGATIDEINTVRKHCSTIKGGGLARATAPATLCTLLVSDVVGDDPSVIASGPTVPDPSTYADALAVLDRYDLDTSSIPASIRTHLRAGAAGTHPETAAPDDAVFDRVETLLLGNGRTALEAAGDAAAARGYTPVILASGVRGEARDAALTHVAIAAECREYDSPVEPPTVLLSGGETTVTLGADPGAGGPNGEFVTSSGVALATNDGNAHAASDSDSTPAISDSTSNIVIASVDTDGIDGSTNAAGGMVDAKTLDPNEGRASLDRHDTFPLLADMDALITTGPTGTNVNDLRVMVVDRAAD